MWRRVASNAVGVIACSYAVLLGVLLMTDSAIGADLPDAPVAPVYKAPAEVLSSRFYVGAALNRTHHTGYVPDSPWSAQQYAWGGKVFGGYRFNETVAFEVAYHYLGEVSFYEGLPVWSQEKSYAFSGSAVFVSPALSGPTPVPMHGFLRLGLAYKDINHWSTVGTFHEGILSGVLGAGLEIRPTANVFVRFEYEFISTAIGGPMRPVPILNSLTTVSFGGTHRAINVMNTPLALTMGINL